MNQIGNLAIIKITHSCISENVSNLCCLKHQNINTKLTILKKPLMYGAKRVDFRMPDFRIKAQNTVHNAYKTVFRPR